MQNERMMWIIKPTEMICSEILGKWMVMYKILTKRIQKSIMIAIAPKNPHSSQITEKIKSV